MRKLLFMLPLLAYSQTGTIQPVTGSDITTSRPTVNNNFSILDTRTKASTPSGSNGDLQMKNNSALTAAPINCVGENCTATGTFSIGSTVAGARLSVNRIANGAIALHSIVKGVAANKVGPVASDTEGILGVAENATNNDGDAIVVTELGPTTILCESATDLNYLIAGTDPTKVKDSGLATLNGIPATTRIIAKATGACTGGIVTANVIGPYRFGAQAPAIPVSIQTSGPVSDIGGTSVVYVNNASGALTFSLPVGVSGYQRCYRNATGKIGAITVLAPSSNAIDLYGVNGATQGTVVSGTYTSGCSATGSANQTCTLTSLNGSGGSNAAATVNLTGTDTIAAGTALVITNNGSGYTAISTSATCGNGTATCTGTATIVTQLGGSIISSGALGDALCMISDAANHWYAYPNIGFWTNY